MLNRTSIRPDIHFWLNTIEYFNHFYLTHLYSLTNNALNNTFDICIIVPTANHIHICEQAWINKQQNNNNSILRKSYALPKIQTLKYILEQYNTKYAAPSNYSEHLNLYQFCKQEIQNKRFSILKDYTNKQLWQFVQQCVHICHELTETYLSQHFACEYLNNIEENIQIHTHNLQQHLNQHYHNLSLKMVDMEAHILLAIWQHTLNINYQPFYTWRLCKHFAAITTQTILYIAFDKQDSYLQQIIQTFTQHNKLHKLCVVDIDLYTKFNTSNINNIDILNSSNLLKLFPETAITSTSTSKNINININIQNNNNDNNYNLCLQQYFNQQHIIECNDLEETCNYILYAITQAILQGQKKLALIAQDRIAIRRIKALLQVHHIPLVDETGWKFVSTLLATCIKQWLDMVAQQEINALWVEQYISKLNKDKDKDKDKDIDIDIDIDKTILSYCKIWQKPHTLPQWLDIWYTWCEYLQFDIMEHTLNSLCEHINDLCAADRHNIYTFQEWSILLQNILEQSNVSDLYAHSLYKVHILALNGARLRTFDCVWFIGCDDAQLPSRTQHTLFLNENIRYSLGLETQLKRFKQQCIDFLSLMYAHINFNKDKDQKPKIEFIYQAYHTQNKHILLSRFLQKLHHFAEMPYILARDILNKAKKNLPEINNQHSIFASENITASTINTSAKFPNIGEYRITHLNSYDIMDLYLCPYRFYLKKVAGLNTPYIHDSSNNKDYGSWIHTILHHAHQRPGTFEVQTQLHESTENILKQFVLDAPAREFKQQWLTQIPLYATWYQKHQQQYTWLYGEFKFSLDIPVGSSNIRLSTRIDRIDSINSTENTKKNTNICIIDYKWQHKKNIDKSKYMQLLIYYYVYTQNNPTKKNKEEQENQNIQIAFLPLKDNPEMSLFYPYENANIEVLANDLMQDVSTKLYQYQEEQALFEAKPSKECRHCDYRYMCEYKNKEDVKADNTDI